jgi:ABC-type polysaccharide/polyol phosphate export permease
MAIILIFGVLSRSDQNVFGPHVVIGFLVYGYITNLVIHGCSVFISNHSWIKSMRLPYGVFIYKGIMENTIILIFNLFAALIILLFFFDLEVSIYQLLLIPAFLVILLNSVALYMLLGVLCARYRDFLHLIQTIMRFALFITPIMWVAEDMGLRGAIALYNPLTHFIEIFRTPILYGDPALRSWIVVLVITLVTWLIALATFLGCRKRIIFWL